MLHTSKPSSSPKCWKPKAPNHKFIVVLLVLEYTYFFHLPLNRKICKQWTTNSKLNWKKKIYTQRNHGLKPNQILSLVFNFYQIVLYIVWYWFSQTTLNARVCKYVNSYSNRISCILEKKIVSCYWWHQLARYNYIAYFRKGWFGGNKPHRFIAYWATKNIHHSEHHLLNSSQV